MIQRQRATVYLLDRDEAVRDALTMILEIEGYAVVAFDSAVAFLELRQPDLPGCLLADLDLPQISGFDLVRTLADRRIFLPTILMSAQLRRPRRDHLPADVVAILEKPFADRDLLIWVARALARSDALSSLG